MGGLRQARLRFERQLGSEGDDEVVVVELVAIGADTAVLEVDLADVGVDELDAPAGELGAAPADGLGPALAGHDPEVGRREGGLRLAVDDDDSMGCGQEAAGLAGGDDAADAAAEDEDG